METSKYPRGFDPNHFAQHPPIKPSPTLVETTTLYEETDSYCITLDLEWLRETHPNATHIYIEQERGRESSDDQCKMIIERREEKVNSDYDAQMEVYKKKLAEHQSAKEAWQCLSQQWHAEKIIAEQEVERQVYLRLKAKFEPSA